MIGRATALATLAALPLGMGAARVAVADDPGATPTLASACQLDFQLFCPDLDPESSRKQVMACLHANLDALTEECRAVIDPASVPRPTGRPHDALDDACHDDFVRLCGQATDRLSFARCVRTQRGNLSNACRAALDARAGVVGRQHSHPAGSLP